MVLTTFYVEIRKKFTDFNYSFINANSNKENRSACFKFCIINLIT